MIESPSRDLLRRTVVDGTPETREDFLDHFEEEVEVFVDALKEAYDAVAALGVSLEEGLGNLPEKEGRRRLWLQLFLLNALNCLVVSGHLMIAGMLVYAGNTMRQFGESIAMATLLSHTATGQFERFESEGKKYPVHDSLKILSKRKNRKRLGINDEGWENWKNITEWYDRYSHPSALAVYNLWLDRDPGQIAIGGEFDSNKVDVYKHELGLRISATQLLPSIIGHLERHALTTALS